MIKNINQAVNSLAEKVSDNEKKLNYFIKQRNSKIVDIYGMEFTRTGLDKSKGTFYISVSPDLIHLMRFQFKVFVIDCQGAKDWYIKVKRSSGDIDITPYLKYQAEKGDGSKWFDGTNSVFPASSLDTDKDGIEQSFDLIDVSNSLYAEDRDDDGNYIMKSGLKQIEIGTNEDKSLDFGMLLYLKYSHINR